MSEYKIIDEIIHPIRLRIIYNLLDNDEGTSTKELNLKMNDIAQATLYRHIQFLSKNNVIYTYKKVKVKGTLESYYKVSEKFFKFSLKDWLNPPSSKKLDYMTFFQLHIMREYSKFIQHADDDELAHTIIATSELVLNNKQFIKFLDEINALMLRYYSVSEENKKSAQKDSKTRIAAISVIPEKFIE